MLTAAKTSRVAAGEPSRPDAPDWTIDQGWAATTRRAEHAVWKTLYERQSALLPGRACDEFVAGHAGRCPSAPTRSRTSSA